MKNSDLRKTLFTAMDAAVDAGAMMAKNLNRPKKINSSEQHDIKLDLDVRCQKLIERKLRAEFPEAAILGEEGTTGDLQSETRWVVDPIDGTVNFTYGIPHACVSIALQRRTRGPKPGDHPDEAFETVVGVVFDPFCGEMFSAIKGAPAKLNGKAIRVSPRAKLDEAIVSIGFSKSPASLAEMLPRFNKLVPQVRKVRLMGAAALAIAYVASGRFDGYLEAGVRLWDIAAGGLILECAGGDFFFEPIGEDHTYRIVANNGKLRRKLIS